MEKDALMINVSSLSGYEYCPRSIYLRGVLKIKPEPNVVQVKGLVGHFVRKELSLRQARLLSRIKEAGEIKSMLEAELDSIIEDIPFIYKEKIMEFGGEEEYRKHTREVKAELLNEIKTISERLSAMVDELGIERALELTTPWKVEYSLKSEKLKLTGRVDKIMRQDRGAGVIPVEIKTGTEGLWEADRIQVCAYGMLLEDKFNVVIPHGFVEYTKVQERKPVLNTEQLRRKVIGTRDSVLDILSGRHVPAVCPHGSGRKCEACGLSEKCYEI